MGFFQSLGRYLGRLSPAHISCFTALRGRLVGEDQFHNKYFCGKARRGYKNERRWVVYKKAPEASAVPPEWHGWLHHQTDRLPDAKGESFRRPWQKPHKRNLTGTSGAYRPPGHILEGGQRAKATGDYDAWRPPQ